jgi:hypothetical protein
MSEPAEAIKVFVSYTHDSLAHSRRVLDLSNALRLAGFDCDIDQYHANQDWPIWMERSGHHGLSRQPGGGAGSASAN